jgi:hypothetical protein
MELVEPVIVKLELRWGAAVLGTARAVATNDDLFTAVHSLDLLTVEQ